VVIFNEKGKEMKIFAVNGVAKSGKDSFCNLVRETACESEQRVTTISTIDPIKELYSDFFKWDGDKFKDHHRKNLNTLKQVWISSCNGPHRWTIETLKGLQDQGFHTVFVMVREYEEMIDVVNIGNELFEFGRSIQIVRLGLSIPPVEREFLESHPEDYVYDCIVVNPTTNDPYLSCLKESAKRFWNTTPQDFNMKYIINEESLPGYLLPMSIRDLIIKHSA